MGPRPQTTELKVHASTIRLCGIMDDIPYLVRTEQHHDPQPLTHERNKHDENGTRAIWDNQRWQKAELFTLTNNHGMEVKISDYGGTIVSLVVPDKMVNLATLYLVLTRSMNICRRKSFWLSRRSLRQSNWWRQIFSEWC